MNERTMKIVEAINLLNEEKVGFYRYLFDNNIAYVPLNIFLDLFPNDYDIEMAEDYENICHLVATKDNIQYKCCTIVTSIPGLSKEDKDE